ncbi:hypothetical protein [Nannocystis sp. SCPEA4]|uniref:hypothetical protein n=1 Tax=Nannocystis sp. SCPEA4 TaxID=2996787 RepID=UPI002271872C|nr:hypothetical protein [Nannocystis sp. SCPEA4]MCY1059228.1 hypothetical protein [Nannocystis sp. SCPEA4]
MRNFYRATFHCFLFALGFVAACDQDDISSREGEWEPIACSASDRECPVATECLDDAGAACDFEKDPKCVGECYPVDGLCGGPLHIACAEGWICVDLADDCDLERDNDCLGGCRPAPDAEPQPDLSPIGPCGGKDGAVCPEGEYCADLDDSCHPERGHEGCEGVCRPEEQPLVCGGLAGLRCPGKLACVDDATDECDPDAGDTDCIGTCQERPSRRRYVSHSREECAVIQFPCAYDWKPFFEETGCGCEPK